MSKNKIEFKFKSFQEITEVFSKNFQQILGNKGVYNIEGVELTRRNQLLFISKTLEYMKKTMKENETECALAITGIEHAVGRLARNDNWSNYSDFADRLDEVVGKAAFDKRNKKTMIKMSAVDENKCLTEAQKFLQHAIYKNNDLNQGLKDQHLYTSSDCKTFNTTMVWTMVCQLLSEAKIQVQNESEREKKKRLELENDTKQPSMLSLSYWKVKKEPQPIVIKSSVDQFVEDQNEDSYSDEHQNLNMSHEENSEHPGKFTQSNSFNQVILMALY